MLKDTTEKFRLSSQEKDAIRRAARIAKIQISELIRLCLISECNVDTKPDVLRRAAKDKK